MPEIFDTIGQQAEQVVAPNAVINGANGRNGACGEEEEDDEQRVGEEIESLCMNCHDNGITRLLLTKIPYFKEVILMSFSCDHCGFQNNEIQPAGTVQLKGVHYELRLISMSDFERRVVKSDTAVVKFIEMDVEIPAGRGQLTNVEGLLTKIVDDLTAGQEERLDKAAEVYEKLEEIIATGRKMLAGEAFPFRMTVDDPAGNSFVEPNIRDGVGKWEKREYLRTPEQNAGLGLTNTVSEGLDDEGNLIPDQVYEFPASCPGCMHPCTTNMKMVDIPHFRQVVIMNTTCDDCGYKSNDVKTGGEIPEKGKKMTLHVRTSLDLARDILKSESCELACPELNLSVNAGTLGGRFTTVEGLLAQIRDDLKQQIFEADGAPGQGGDSLSSDERMQWTDFFDGLDAATKGEKEFHVVLTDPLACSYVQSLANHADEPDPQLVVEEYERTDEEEEELGLKDMKTEGYEEDAATGGENQTVISAAWPYDADGS